jgi:hypothetical protein
MKYNNQKKKTDVTSNYINDHFLKSIKNYVNIS